MSINCSDSASVIGWGVVKCAPGHQHDLDPCIERLADRSTIDGRNPASAVEQRPVDINGDQADGQGEEPAGYRPGADAGLRAYVCST